MYEHPLMAIMVLFCFILAIASICFAMAGEDREQRIKDCEYSHDPAHIYGFCCKCGYVSRKHE